MVPSPPWEGVAFVLAVFVCVLLHEFGHISVARYFGIRTPDITLLPIGGVANLERIPREPRQELLIAIAGPLVNIALAGLIIAALGGVGGLDQTLEPHNPHGGFLARLAAVNVFLVLFNLIPAFPMDGGRVLRAILASRLTWARATHIAAAIGQGLALILGLAGLFYNPWLIVIAIFVYFAAAGEEQNAQIEAISAQVCVGDVMITKFETLPRSASVGEAVDKLLATTQSEFPVVETDGHIGGWLTRDSIIKALREHGPETSVAQTMRCDIPEIGERAPLAVGLKRMRELGAPAIAVLDNTGLLIGFLNYETLGELMMIRAAATSDFALGHRRLY